MNGNIFEIIERLGKKEYFYIVFIVVFSIGFIKLLQPDSTILIGIFLGVIIIFFYISNVIYKADNSTNTLLNKYNYLPIKPERFILKYENIINFLYDIREYYDYNLSALNDLVIELNNFFILYDDLIVHNYVDCQYTYDNLANIKLKLVNILATYIYSIPDDVYLIENLSDKQKEFDMMLQEYLNDIISKCDISTFKKTKPYPSNMLY
jgi:hypothetical protein